MAETESTLHIDPAIPVHVDHEEAPTPPEVARTTAILRQAVQRAGVPPAEAAAAAMTVAAEHHAAMTIR